MSEEMVVVAPAKKPRLPLVILLLSLFFFLSGGQFLYVKLNNPTVTRMSCAEYLEKRPSVQWLELSGCELPLFAGTVLRSAKSRPTAFVPIRAAADLLPGARDYAIFETADPSIVALVDEALGAPSDPTERAAFVEKNQDRLTLHRTVRGLVPWGREAHSTDRGIAAELLGDLEPDHVFINDDDEPSLVPLIIMWSFGAALLGVAFYVRHLLGKRGSVA